MKKIITVLILGIIILYIINSLPRKYESEINAVMFKLGDMEYEEEIAIEFKGYKTNRLFMLDKFKGKFSIDDKEYDLVELKLGTHQVLGGRDNDIDDCHIIGDMFIDDDMSTLTINYHVDGSWSVKDGVVISGPARNRKEALLITKEFYSSHSMLKNAKVK